jgi:hypothetical protein
MANVLIRFFRRNKHRYAHDYCIGEILTAGRGEPLLTPVSF